MTRAPGVAGKQVVAALSRAGFVVDRVTVVPIHGGEVIGPGLLTSIIGTCELTVEEFRVLLG